MSSDANPYAPPAAEAASAPTGLWSVSGKDLLISDGASLPPVDLLGDQSRRDLTPAAFQFQVAAVMGQAQIAVIAGCGAAVVIAKFAFGGGELWVGVLAYILLTRIVGGSKGGGQARMCGFVSVVAQRAWARRQKWRARLLWLGLAAVVIPNLALIGGVLSYRGRVDTGEMIGWIIGSAVVGMLLAVGAAFWRVFDPGVVCQRVRDGWFQVKGIHPAALHQLALRAHEPPPEMRLREVFSVRQYELPLGMLVRRVRNPWTLVMLALMRAGKSPRLERLDFTRRESRRIDPEDADPDLLSHWMQETRGSEMAEWRAFQASILDSPHRDMRTHSLMFASPDRRYFAMVAMVRMVVSGRLLEEKETAVRSSTTDGTCLLTSSQRMPVELPSAVEFRHARGRLPAMLESHMLHASGRALAVLDEAEFSAALELEIDHRHAAFEAAGIYGPTEMRELQIDG